LPRHDTNGRHLSLSKAERQFDESVEAQLKAAKAGMLLSQALERPRVHTGDLQMEILVDEEMDKSCVRLLAPQPARGHCPYSAQDGSGMGAR